MQSANIKNICLRRRRLCRFICLGFGASTIIFCSSSARKAFSVVEGPFAVRHFSVSPDSALGISGVPSPFGALLLTPLCGCELRYAHCRTHAPWRPTSCPRASDVSSTTTIKQKTHCSYGNGSRLSTATSSRSSKIQTRTKTRSMRSLSP